MKSIVLQVLMFISNTQHILQANQYQRLATASSIKLTEWCNDIPFDHRCSVPASWCVQVTSLLPLVSIRVVSQHIRQPADAVPAPWIYTTYRYWLHCTLYIVPVHLWLGTVHQCWHQPYEIWERGGQQPGSMQRQWGQGSRSRSRRPLHSPQCPSQKSPLRWLWKPALRMLQYFGLIDKNIVMCIVWMLSKF